MRGQRVFNEIIKGSGICKSLRKGRSLSLLQKRNDCLVARYYYYGTVKNKGFEETLRLLLSEFYLSPATITNIVLDSVEQLKQLKQKGPTQYYFQNRWPHMKW